MKTLRKLVFGLGAIAVSLPGVAYADDLRSAIAADIPDLMAIYRDLHANPELSLMEVRSAAKLAAEARMAGFVVTEKVGGTGIVAVMENGPGPVVMLRADMDGLPVTEQTGLPYASKVVVTLASGVETGVMHACGHDTHMTAWVGIARLMAARKDQWSGTLVMIGQPAEETGQGAEAMLADGLFTRFPKPDYTLAFHDRAGAPAGLIGYASGFALANVDSVDITVHGVGGHGAYPHATKDPIVLASAIVMRLQTLISRESDPLQPGVVTVGSFHAGSKHNIISDEARLQLTVRSYTDEQRKLLLDGISRIAAAEAMASGIAADKMPEVKLAEGFTPALYNSPELTASVVGALRERFGEDRVENTPPTMGGEDFARYRRADPDSIQSLMLWVGGERPEVLAAAKASGVSPPSLHSPFWAPDAEAVVATGVEALASSAMRLMPPR